MISSTEQIILAVLSTPILIAYLTALIYYVYKYTTLQASPCHLTISANGTLIGMIAMYIFFIRLWRVVDHWSYFWFALFFHLSLILMAMLAKHRQSLDIPKYVSFGWIRSLITLIILLLTNITILSLQYPIFPFYARFREFHYMYTEAEQFGLKIGIWALIPYSVPIFLMVRYVWRLKLAKRLEIWKDKRLLAVLERGEYGWRRREIVLIKKSPLYIQNA